MKGPLAALAFLCLMVGPVLSYAQDSGLKKIVAVSRFDNKSSYHGQWHIDNGMADQLTDALIRSGRFVVLERQTLKDVLDEQDLAASGRAQKSQSAKTGKLTSAQILIKGAVTEFEERTSGGGAGIGIMGFRLGGRKEDAHVGLIIRLIDTTTGKVLDSQRVEGRAESGGVGLDVYKSGVAFGTDAFSKTPLGKATQAAIDNAVEIIASKLKNVPFQARIIKTSGSEIYVGASQETGTTVGTVFGVYTVGEELTDPVTGEILGAEEKKIGSIEIVEVKEKYSKAKVLSGKGFERGNIIRTE
ncbi:MAG: CsgG/HfaB family protein [Chloroflexota bacterium]